MKKILKKRILNTTILSDEVGRSMVEMLGVLAIVGVISIGGIAGYNYGINKYRANEIMDGAMKRAVVVSSQLSTGIRPNLSEFEDDNVTAGGTFQNYVREWDGEFGIKVTGVTSPVCQNLIRMRSETSPVTDIVATEGNGSLSYTLDSCALRGEENNLFLVFNNDMQGGDRNGSGYNGDGYNSGYNGSGYNGGDSGYYWNDSGYDWNDSGYNGGDSGYDWNDSGYNGGDSGYNPWDNSGYNGGDSGYDWNDSGYWTDWFGTPN
ncbi:MAG: hypothetical protein SPL08_04175 [Pseudomonadota bacterium]|nr:hypothetical protein [Pseudomonadota bacterium]